MPTPSDSLSEFLSGFEVAQSAPGDAEASKQFQRWVQAHPEAALRLVSRVQAAEAELEAARRELTRQERARRMGVQVGPSAEELQRQSQAWSKLLGTSGARRQRAAAAEGSGAAAAGPRTLTFEDIGARFVHAHVGKLWLGLAVVAAVVVAVR